MTRESGRVLTAMLALLGWASVAAAAPDSAAPAARPPQHKIAVDVRGPVAMVQVTRVLYPSDDGHAPGEAVLDVALPAHAALVDLEISDAGRWRPVDPIEPGRGRDLYVEALRQHGMTAAAEPFDDTAVYRIRASLADPHVPGDTRLLAPVTVRYRFTAIADFAGGRRRLRFPAAPETTPVAAEVNVTVGAATDVEIAGARTTLGGGASGHASGRAATRSGWEVSWAPKGAPPGDAPALDGTAVAAPLGSGESAVAFVVQGRPARPAPPPANVLFLIDRSKSVGLPGLSAERDLARRLLETLPPTTRFDALFFDRATKRLFPMSRPATREAIAALEGELVPDRLQNGTDLAAALREATALLRREASAFAPRTLVAILTDGALPDEQDAAALDAALESVPGVELAVAAFAVRMPDDDPVAPAAHQALRALAGAHGGILRDVRANEIEDAVPEALAALAAGGDVARVRMAAAGQRGEPRALADKLAPGEGLAGIARLPVRAGSALEIQGMVRGHNTRMPLRPAAVDAGWLRPHLDGGALTRFVATGSVVALVEPVLRPSPPVEPRVTGSLDRIVVRNTLSLAYMPRARACYLNRSSATPSLRDLAGRVRVAIDLVRGEVTTTTIQSSTLNHPEIEGCLREGAFAIEVPRALHSDAPVQAILNLVFRPRTPEKPKLDETVLGNQIDLVIEELHREEAIENGRDEIRPPAPPLP